MSTLTCPNGHESTSSDYCDICGAPMTQAAGPQGAEGSSASAPAAGPDAAGAPDAANAPDGTATAASPALEACPNCGAEHEAAALFCEACGYDFTTGTMPRPPDATPASALDLDAGSTGSTGSAESAAAGGAAAAAASGPVPVAPAIADEWVAEMWVDPDWYEAQESEDPCPSPGLPAVIRLSLQSVLIGRPSASRNIHPDIDCTGDPGVSRRQAQLTTDGQRWWIEDLQSSNGTYVGPASGPLPTEAVPAGQRRELAEDDRVYVGAWTRLVVRRATAEELGTAAP